MYCASSSHVMYFSSSNCFCLIRKFKIYKVLVWPCILGCCRQGMIFNQVSFSSFFFPLHPQNTLPKILSRLPQRCLTMPLIHSLFVLQLFLRCLFLSWSSLHLIQHYRGEKKDVGSQSLGSKPKFQLFQGFSRRYPKFFQPLFASHFIGSTFFTFFFWSPLFLVRGPQAEVPQSLPPIMNLNPECPLSPTRWRPLISSFSA